MVKPLANVPWTEENIILYDNVRKDIKEALQITKDYLAKYLSADNSGENNIYKDISGMSAAQIDQIVKMLSFAQKGAARKIWGDWII
jgi:hypothetical protein